MWWMLIGLHHMITISFMQFGTLSSPPMAALAWHAQQNLPLDRYEQVHCSVVNECQPVGSQKGEVKLEAGCHQSSSNNPTNWTALWAQAISLQEYSRVLLREHKKSGKSTKVLVPLDIQGKYIKHCLWARPTLQSSCSSFSKLYLRRMYHWSPIKSQNIIMTTCMCA